MGGHLVPRAIPARGPEARCGTGPHTTAIATDERYLATPRLLGPCPLLDAPLLAGIHKRLGELYEARGDRQKAISHYVQFVALWKDADPELQPKVAQVKQRLAHLQS